MAFVHRFPIMVLLAVALASAACSSSDADAPSPASGLPSAKASEVAPVETAVPSRDPISPDAVQSARAVQSLLERYTAAWETKRAGAVLALYADDVRFTDALAGWWDEPRATLEQMVRDSVQIPDLGGGPSSYFVDTTGGMESMDGWGLGDSTKANPIHEVDVFETEGGLFTSMHTVYDVKSLAHITGQPVADFAAMQDLIQGYADAWSSGDPASVTELYAEAATRGDTLRGDSAEGREAVSEAAARSFSSYPGAVWQDDIVFGDSGVGGVMTGGIFTVRFAEPNACDLGAAVVLETNEAQEIVTERVYWDLHSLIRCGLSAA